MSADEIDAELLAMAGDSSEDEGDEIDQTQVVEDELSDSEFQEPAPRTVEAPTRTRGVAQKVKARGRRKRKQQESDLDDDDMNDDPADRSPSPPYSPDANARNDSENEADGADGLDDEAPLFPLEGKFENARDREAIMAMNEIEREELLAERAAQVLRRQQDLQLRKALADSRASANRNKRKAIDTEDEDGSRRNTRPKTDKRSALDDYRKAREQKGAERNRLDQNRSDRNARSPTPRSVQDAEGESEVEWAEPATDKHRNDPPAELKDFERCRVGRSNFARVCFYPAFEETIRGCFCRINIGLSKETGQAEYRMTQIKGGSIPAMLSGRVS
jgi:RNA polymerase-associated protein RTF1